MTRTWTPIHQDLPDVATYAEDRVSLTWDRARAELAGMPGNRGLNLAHESMDRHVDEGRGDVTALRCIALDGAVTYISYARLRLGSARVLVTTANLGWGGRGLGA